MTITNAFKPGLFVYWLRTDPITRKVTRVQARVYKVGPARVHIHVDSGANNFRRAVKPERLIVR